MVTAGNPEPDEVNEREGGGIEYIALELELELQPENNNTGREGEIRYRTLIFTSLSFLFFFSVHYIYIRARCCGIKRKSGTAHALIKSCPTKSGMQNCVLYCSLRLKSLS
jgi:hypothetical protein